jgi:pilus assembly protein Flp/PilA
MHADKVCDTLRLTKAKHHITYSTPLFLQRKSLEKRAFAKIFPVLERSISFPDETLSRVRDTFAAGRFPMKTIARFFKNEDGATAIEYGLIAALIAVVVIGAVTTVGTSLSGTFANVATAVK